MHSRAAVSIYSHWWSAFSATYPFGEVVADAEGITVRVPWFKTARIARDQIIEFRPIRGLSGVLRWFVMPGYSLVHKDPDQPRHITFRVPDIERFRKTLESLGYKCVT
jgi:hypothetical protein